MGKAIRVAPDAKAIHDRLTILRRPAILPQDMSRPRPELKTLLLKSLETAIQNHRSGSQRQNQHR